MGIKFNENITFKIDNNAKQESNYDNKFKMRTEISLGRQNVECILSYQIQL